MGYPYSKLHPSRLHFLRFTCAVCLSILLSCRSQKSFSPFKFSHSSCWTYWALVHCSVDEIYRPCWFWPQHFLLMRSTCCAEYLSSYGQFDTHRTTLFVHSVDHWKLYFLEKKNSVRVKEYRVFPFWSTYSSCILRIPVVVSAAPLRYFFPELVIS